MRRFLLVFAIAISVLCVSCVTETDPLDIRGVWKCVEDDQEYRFIFTSDGYYAFEHYSEGYLGYVEFGSYENDNLTIYTDGDSHDYVRDGKSMTISLWEGDMVFSRISISAKNNTSADNLLGVWEGVDGRVAFAKGGTVISSSSWGSLYDYFADAEAVTIDDYPCDYLIINSRLYLEDGCNMFNSNAVVAFDRLTSSGEDQTFPVNLYNNNPWHLVDIDYGTNHYIYNFSSNGNYTRVYYHDSDIEDKTESSGTYSYDDHIIELSDDSDLAFAIVDQYAFMFSI